jgi:hypothetical protein
MLLVCSFVITIAIRNGIRIRTLRLRLRNISGMLFDTGMCFRNNISHLIILIMVTTRSHHINNNQTRDPLSVSVDNNPITTQNIIMTPTVATTAWTLNSNLMMPISSLSLKMLIV